MSVEEILLIVTFILQWVLLFIASNTTKSAVEMLESQGLKIQSQKELIDNQEELIETLQDRLKVYDEAMLKAMQDEPQIDCHKCADFWNCDGQCDEVEDKPQTEYPCETCANNGDHNGECQNCVSDAKVIRWKRPSHYKPEVVTERSE